MKDLSHEKRIRQTLKIKLKEKKYCVTRKKWYICKLLITRNSLRL